MFKYLLYFLLLLSSFTFGQEISPIINYNPNIYKGGNQNWMITQDSNNYIYIANNDGLLEFNGANWNTYPSPNETIIRSVKAYGDKIYTGSYMDFGYWERKYTNKLEYTSISKKLNLNLIDDEQFWNIIPYDNWIVFQSLDAIYIYNIINQKIKRIKPKNKIFKSFITKESIYFQVLNEGVYELKNGKAHLVINNSIVKESKIIGLFGIQNKKGLIIFTQNDGFFKFDEEEINLISKEYHKKISQNNIYSITKLMNGNYAVGTISDGIFLLDENGEILSHVNQNRGLLNNTVLSCLEDDDANLWLGLDNGISCINLNSPIHVFTDLTGKLGTVYTATEYDEYLYIGTNQGLFYRKNDTENEFTLLPQTKGQVWSLKVIDNKLFCAHDSGTFIIENNIVNKIFSNSGTWKFETLEKYPDLIFQGNYFGLSVLKKINNKWEYSHKISNFNLSSKYFEFLNENEVFMSHEYKGIFKLKIDSDFKKITYLKKLDEPGISKNSSLIQFKGKLLYANKSGVYIYNPKKQVFLKNEFLSQIYNNDNYTSGIIIINNDNFWLFSENFIHLFREDILGNNYKKKSIPIPYSITNPLIGYENITRLSSGKYLIGSTDGYYTINIDKLKFKTYKTYITNVKLSKAEDDYVDQSIQEDGVFNYKENNIKFGFAIPDFNKYIFPEFQFKLEGLHENWSKWSSNKEVTFENLPPGDYTFKVRSRLGDTIHKDIASYSFEVLSPWYKTSIAIIVYFILGLTLIYFMHKIYKKYYREKEKKLIEENNLLLEIAALENEKQLMKIKNEKLSAEFQLKNKELAASTMSLMKKDKLLELIKDDLRNSESSNSSSSIKTVISKITKNIDKKESWEVFKEAFDNADNDFLKKLKKAHPTLTPNDLRLCAYLRLNLSSKEIAPLLNISVRSVEIKRYRLRKKMELPHEEGLVDYILNV